MKYPKHILDLNKNDLRAYIDFHNRLFNIHSYTTREKAWEALERIFHNHFDKHRFDSYESFMNARSRYFKKRVK